MGLIKRMLGAIERIVPNFSRNKTYNADELRKGRKQDTGTGKTRLTSFNRRKDLLDSKSKDLERRSAHKELYYSHRAEKNESCKYASTKGFTIN